jgi:hypothetical protein
MSETQDAERRGTRRAGPSPNALPDGRFLELCIQLREHAPRMTIEEPETLNATVASLREGRPLTVALKEGITRLHAQLVGRGGP